MGNTKGSIKVLSAGCNSCKNLFEMIKTAVKNLNLDCSVEYITDMAVVMSYGVMSMPAIVINEKVVSSGKLYTQDKLEKLIKESL